MSIVRMKRLRLVTMADDREKLLRMLAKLGVVEISETQAEDGLSPVTETDADKLSENLAEVLAAQNVAKKYGKIKKGLLSPRGQVSEDEIFSDGLIDEALCDAVKINSCEAEINSLSQEKIRLATLKETFVPWENLEIPLSLPSGNYFETSLITVPRSVTFEDAKAYALEGSENAELFEVSSDKELRYMMLVSYRDDAEAVRNQLKQVGAAIVKFRGVECSARERIKELEREISEVEKKIKEKSDGISVSTEQYDKLLAAQDAIETKLACERAAACFSETPHTVYIEGWCPAREEEKLVKIFEENGYAYEFADPAEGEVPPTLTYNSKLIAPFNTVTNMYSPPAYGGIDPNPMMAPFFAMFFGIMLSDAGYGLLLMIVGALALWKLKPRGGLRDFMQLAVICGATTIFWGLMFGGIFGNTIPAVYELFTGNKFEGQMALWFDPTNDPMTMLIFSMALGGIQIVTSMGIKAYMMIRDGHVWDAIFDIGSWYLVFGGAVTCIFNATAGLYVLGAGALMLILTQGRDKKNIFGKLVGGIGSLYDITGYFSDMLSYSRLLALSLATAVVSQVINTMGMLTGPIGFFIVFLIGHVFNIAINLIGSFVHSARLQYVEFFGRFYESGGRLFSPLSIKTKNTDIIKEEN